MTLETTIAPVQPYSLALSARMKSDATRFLRDGILTVAFETGGAPALARVSQKPDGKLNAWIESEEPDEALAKLRFVLAADDDHGEFLRRFRDDPLIGNAVRSLGGMRPIRTATVVHSLLKAVCGQLIDSRRSSSALPATSTRAFAFRRDARPSSVSPAPSWPATGSCRARAPRFCG